MEMSVFLVPTNLAVFKGGILRRLSSGERNALAAICMGPSDNRDQDRMGIYK